MPNTQRQILCLSVSWIVCFGLLLFLTAGLIVLALIPVYLKNNAVESPIIGHNSFFLQYTSDSEQNSAYTGSLANLKSVTDQMITNVRSNNVFSVVQARNDLLDNQGKSRIKKVTGSLINRFRFHCKMTNLHGCTTEACYMQAFGRIQRALEQTKQFQITPQFGNGTSFPFLISYVAIYSQRPPNWSDDLSDRNEGFTKTTVATTTISPSKKFYDEALNNLIYVEGYPVFPFELLYNLSQVPVFNVTDRNSIKQALIAGYLLQFPNTDKNISELIANDPLLQLVETTIIDIVIALVEFEGKDKAAEHFTTILTVAAITSPSTNNPGSRRRRSALNKRLALANALLVDRIEEDTKKLQIAINVLRRSWAKIPIMWRVTVSLFKPGITSVGAAISGVYLGTRMYQIYSAITTIRDVVEDLVDIGLTLKDPSTFIDLQSINYYPATLNCDEMTNILNIDLTVRSISNTSVSEHVNNILKKIQGLINLLDLIREIFREMEEYTDKFRSPLRQEEVDNFRAELDVINSDKLKPDPGNEDISVADSENCKGTFDNYVCNCIDLQAGTYKQTILIRIVASNFADSKYDLKTTSDLIVPPCPPVLDADELCQTRLPGVRCPVNGCGRFPDVLFIKGSINNCYTDVPRVVPSGTFTTPGTDCTIYTQGDQAANPTSSPKRKLSVTVPNNTADVGNYIISGCGFYQPGFPYCLRVYPDVTFSGMCGYGCSAQHDRCVPCPCCQYQLQNG